MNSEAAERREAEYGYRTVGGKAFRLQQWSEKKERRDFDALVNRLNALKWQRAVYAEGGERLLKLRARKLAWHHATKAARIARRRGRVLTCPTCGAVWCMVPTAPGQPKKFCSLKCQRADEWIRIRGSKRKNCKRCGGPKLQGQGQRYCGSCKEAAA